jgi:hypothetical protein
MLLQPHVDEDDDVTPIHFVNDDDEKKLLMIYRYAISFLDVVDVFSLSRS